MTTHKIAIITGAGKGIGKAIAIGMSKLNYRCILIGRNKDNLQTLARELTPSKYGTHKIVQLDITDSEKLRQTFTEIVKEFKTVDVLVNNAGIYYDGTVEIDSDNFDRMMNTNLNAQHRILRQVVPQMKKQQSGYIFNVASRAGKIGFAGSGAYSASKFALVGLNESLYRELNPLGIRVTALCPGWVNTQMAYKAGTPLEADQMIQPDDIFSTIKWLLSLSAGACVKEVVIETPHNIS